VPETTRAEMSEIFIQEILKTLPQSCHLVLVDKILRLEEGFSIEALKNVTFTEPYFQGHFPGNPIMPGVLILESIAQACALLILKSSIGEEKLKTVYFAGIREAKFRRPVLPGDQLRLRGKLIRRRGRFWKFRGEAFVGDALVTETQLFLVEVR
jgi:beta-hydroxyacyl-ACP dehydratase FabZ